MGNAKSAVEIPRWLHIASSGDVEIPLNDLTRQYERIKDEVHEAIDRVLPTGRYTLGPYLEQFEREFAAHCGTDYCIGISSGTEALHLALAACGVGPGDEVITVSNTYIATALPITYCGATPVFVDVEPDTYNMDISQVEAKITSRTKAILPVHLYGQCVDMDPLNEIAERHGLWVVEDAAHAHGAEYKGRKAGSLGHIGCFSFYPGKNLGAYGDGGAITTSDPELNDKVRVLRYVGQHVKFVHEVIGFQERLDPLQAAILSVKLKYLDEENERRRHRAAIYDAGFTDLPVVTPKVADYNRHVYYCYTILVDEAQRDDLMAHLVEGGIGTFVIYPTLVPMQPCYRFLGYREEDFPVSGPQAHQLLQIPAYPYMTGEEVEQVVDRVRSFFV
ncbi:MAG: DegT/DnrJ/EryC1/StrS family aminotransferase [Anaerolineae bacterium]